MSDHGQVPGRTRETQAQSEGEDRSLPSDQNGSEEKLPGRYIGTYHQHPFYYSVYLKDSQQSTEEEHAGAYGIDVGPHEPIPEGISKPECPVYLDTHGNPMPLPGFDGPFYPQSQARYRQGHFNLEHGSADADDTKPTKILITNLPSLLPADQYKEFLEIFFEYKRKQDDERTVIRVELGEDASTAVVEFEEPTDVDIVLQKRPISLLGTIVDVEIYTPRTIEVRGPPAIIVEHILELYFENTKRSGGDDIERIEVDDDEHVAFVTFETEKVAQRVVDKKNHTIGKKPIYVTIHTPVNAKESRSAPESEEDEMEFRRETVKENNTDSDEPTPLDTIEVQGPPEVMTEQRLRLYFEHKKSSGGGDVTSVDVDGDMAYVTFETEEVAQRVVDKGNHRLNKKPVSVRLYIPEKDKIPTYHTSESEEDEADGTRDDYDTAPEEEAPLRTIEVFGPPDAIAEDPLTYYFENKRSGGGDIVSIEIDDDVAYITFETEQIAQRVAARDDHMISGKHISVQIHNPEPPIPPEPPRTVLVNGMKTVKSTESVHFYFENRKRSGGGDIEEFRIEETDEDVAYITFEKEEVAAAVVNRSHRFQGCALEVSLYIPPLPTQSRNRNKTEVKSPKKPDIPEEPPKAVKVKGLKKVHSQETVRYHFENKRRSRGGEIVEFKYDEEDDDVAYITFENNDVAEAVANRSHQVDNVELSVSLCTPPKPRPCYEDRVIIEGVKTTTTKTCLFNFLESKTKAVPESLIYGEKEGVVMVTFETNPDFDKLEHISKNLKLEGAFLKVSRVTISNCIIVTDVPENTTKDTVEYYFENNRRSGGGPVEKVDIQGDGSILVYFIDHEIIDHVLKKYHTIDGHSIKVNLYLDRLGCTQGDGSEPRLKILDRTKTKDSGSQWHQPYMEPLNVDGDPDPLEKPSRPQNLHYTLGPSQDYGISGPVSGFYQNYPAPRAGEGQNLGQEQVPGAGTRMGNYYPYPYPYMPYYPPPEGRADIQQ